MFPNNSSKMFIISGLILAASVGFFVSAIVFKGDHKPPCEKQMESQGDQNSFPSEGGMTLPKGAKGNRGFMMPDPAKAKMDSLLGLSKDQIAAIEQQKQASDSLRKALSKKIKDAEIRLHDALNAETISEADLKAIRTELLTLNEQRLDNRIANIRFFISTLTPEQNKKLRDLHLKMMKQMKEGRKGLPEEVSKSENDEGPDAMEPPEPRQDGQRPRMDGQGPHMDGNGPHQDGQGPRHNRQGPREMPPPSQKR
jgi:Spy/CpxP family protein refolding chaperone